MKKYQQLLNEEKYTEASQYLNKSEVSFYGAYLLNMLENRIRSTQEYLLTQEKPVANIYSNEEPTGVPNNTVWIGE